MKIVRDSPLIHENVLLEQCSVGDIFRFIHPGKSVYGFLVLVKLKKIPGNKIQIKYKTDWKYLDKRTNIIKKMDLPLNMVVERKRKLDERDLGPAKECVAEIIAH